MVGDLTATICFDYRNIARIKQMLELAGLTQGVDRLMLNQPDFIGRVSQLVLSDTAFKQACPTRAGLGKLAHGAPDRLVRRRARP